MSSASPHIPDRPVYRASEVCEIVGLQPFILRSWQAEFPDLGVSTRGGQTRVYRKVDVERLLEIKQLLFVEGLTLAGARRRLETERAASSGDTPPIEELFGREVRDRIVELKRGLASLLEMLERDGLPQPAENELTLSAESGGSRRAPVVPLERRARTSSGTRRKGRSTSQGPSRRKATES